MAKDVVQVLTKKAILDAGWIPLPMRKPTSLIRIPEGLARKIDAEMRRDPSARNRSEWCRVAIELRLEELEKRRT